MGNKTLKEAIKQELQEEATGEFDIASCDLTNMSNADYIAKVLVAKAKVSGKSNIVLDIAKLAGEQEDKVKVDVSIDQILKGAMVDKSE